MNGDTDSSTNFSINLGLERLETTPGYTRGRMKVSPNHLNTLGIMHGGAIFTVADTISGMAVVSYGHTVTTVTSNISFLRPGKDTEYIWAEAKVIKHGKTFSVCDCEICNDDHVLLAKSTMTFYHLE